MSTEVTKQYITIEGLASEELFKRKGDIYYVIAKVIETGESNSRIGDQTGSMRYRLHEGVVVQQGVVYELKVRFTAIDNKLGVTIEGAEQSSSKVEVSPNDYSKNFVDNITLREFIKISQLDKKRVGAPFIAKVEKTSEKDGLYVLYDETARIEAKIERKRKRVKGQKNISQLASDKTYNFRKTKLQFQSTGEEKGFKLILVAGFRSIVEEQTAEDKQISMDETQAQKLKNISTQVFIEDSSEYKQIIENTKMNVNAVHVNQDKQSGKIHLEVPAEKVTIGQLQVGNHNQTFEGQVVEVEAYTNPKNKKRPTSFWKGMVKDSTGEIPFFVPQRGLQVIKDETYLFDRVMNIKFKGVHQVTIKKYGSLKPLNPNHPPAVVESVQAPEKFRSDGQRSNNRNRQNRYNNGESRRQYNNGDNRQVRGTKTGGSSQDRPNRQPRDNSKRGNSENNRRGNSRGRNNSNNNNNNNQFKNNRHDTTVETDIINLKPGSNGQNIVGKVFELKIQDDKCKGRIGDKTANIKFDFRLSHYKAINEGDTLFLSNIMNKVDENGFHFITIGKYGKYFRAKKVLNTCNQDNDEHHNLSSIEYIKKTVGQ